MQYPSYKLSFKNQFRTMASLTVYRTGRQQCPSGYSRGEEIRDFYLIHYVMHGCGDFTLNGRSFHVQAGKAFLIYPHMPINYVADEQDPWEFCWVGFNGADAAILMNSTGFTPEMPVITLRRRDEFCGLLLNIYQARGELPHEILRMTSGLYLVMSALVQELYDTYGELHAVEYDWALTPEKKAAIHQQVMIRHELPAFPEEPDHVSWLDGCKVYFRNGWVILRFSGTEPRIRIFAEHETEARARELVRIMADFVGLPRME